mmetsp:Transcript_41124/g.56041  ORF Transcript_41124/g.56041 Transcript_41124/m.56041 type:complete len:203 (-) Transcript_41124:145-753(-)
MTHASQQDWQTHASSVVALMAHGYDATITCQDGQFASLRSLFGLLSPSAAPFLRAKPKIFLVQACRLGETPTLVHPPMSGRRGATDRYDDTSQASCGPPEARNLCEEHDFLWGYATTSGAVAYRGALFAAFREVVHEQGTGTSWLELLQHTNEKLCDWSALTEIEIPSIEIRTTCRGQAFAPNDLVLAEATDGVLASGSYRL